jgi:hypothetical protein
MNDEEFEKKMKRLAWIRFSANALMVLATFLVAFAMSHFRLKSARLQRELTALRANVAANYVRVPATRATNIHITTCAQPGVTVQGSRAYFRGEVFMEGPPGTDMVLLPVTDPNCQRLQQGERR